MKTHTESQKIAINILMTTNNKTLSEAITIVDCISKTLLKGK